jgi:hypothetical protein
MLSSQNIICEENGFMDRKLMNIEVQDPCDVDGYDFSAHGSTKTEHCGCTWSSTTEVDSYTTLTEEVSTASTTSVDLYDIVSQVPFKTCNDHAIDTIFVELVEDPSGRTDTSDGQFSVDYENSNDIHMGSDAPASRYVAIPLQQDSVLAWSDIATSLTLDYS